MPSVTRRVTRRGLLGATVSGLAMGSVAARSDDTAQVGPPPPPPPPAAATATDIVLQINGNHVPLSVDPRTSLLDALREQIGLTGTKKGCDRGSCGACTVHLESHRCACKPWCAAADQARPPNHHP
jgi:xanthine dehydrogenase YagT iron-sulfur-binding subunit